MIRRLFARLGCVPAADLRRAIEEREKHFRALESIFAPRTADGEEYPVSRGLPASPFHGGR